MDFLNRLQDEINTIPNLPMKLKQGYLGVGESLVIYSLPGSTLTQVYMDGTEQWQMNYEIAMQSEKQRDIDATLWAIHNKLDTLNKLSSNDDSFHIEGLSITDKPFINQIDEQGWFVFLLSFQADIIINKE